MLNAIIERVLVTNVINQKKKSNYEINTECNLNMFVESNVMLKSFIAEFLQGLRLWGKGRSHCFSLCFGYSKNT